MSVSIDQWRAEGRTADLLGREIFYVDSGDLSKPVVFLIHGFPTSSWDWAPIRSPLSESHRVVAIDMLGFGFSDKPRHHTYSIMEQADLCEALVRRLDLREMHVLAHDYGDTVAQELLARQNEGNGAGQWRSLCLLNGGLFPETHRARPIQRLLLSPIGPIITKVSSKRTFDRSFSAVFGPNTKPSAHELESFWCLINYNDGKIVFHRLITYMNDRKTHRERWVRALRESVVPLALINGAADPVSGAHMVERYREIVSSDHFISMLPKIGHYPQLEAPTEMLAAYRRFLSTI